VRRAGKFRRLPASRGIDALLPGGERSRNYLRNAYRVLLTRARQGMVIFVPPGDSTDHTRPPSYYDATFDYLRNAGVPLLG
jgi:hypothetical protein